jgi:hypothetical protein
MSGGLLRQPRLFAVMKPSRAELRENVMAVTS